MKKSLIMFGKKFSSSCTHVKYLQKFFMLIGKSYDANSVYKISCCPKSMTKAYCLDMLNLPAIIKLKMNPKTREKLDAMASVRNIILSDCGT